ncbi:protein of unknown function (plasmid) [Caballeronia sp. S22]
MLFVGKMNERCATESELAACCRRGKSRRKPSSASASGALDTWKTRLDEGGIEAPRVTAADGQRQL